MTFFLTGRTVAADVRNKVWQAVGTCRKCATTVRLPNGIPAPITSGVPHLVFACCDNGHEVAGYVNEEGVR